MRTINLYRYTLPLQSGLVLRTKTLSCREGLLVQLIENGQEGWGEIAPLPTFSQESLAEATTQAQRWLSEWREGKESGLERLAPSVAFGLSMAQYELQRQLGEQADFSTVPLCTDCSAETFAKLQGKTLAKLKIGRNTPQQDGQTAARLFQALPDLRLRLDANRAWTVAQAHGFAEQLTQAERKRIEFIEEPCHTSAASLQFAQEAGVAIAWDESLRTAGFEVKSQPNVAACIIKPMLTGSLARCLLLIKQAKACQMQAVISSSLESSLGLSQLARLAFQYTPNTPAGLDTLNLMPYQLLRQWGNSTLPMLNLNNKHIEFISI